LEAAVALVVAAGKVEEAAARWRGDPVAAAARVCGACSRVAASGKAATKALVRAPASAAKAVRA
jgi:hypothetical protein